VSTTSGDQDEVVERQSGTLQVGDQHGLGFANAVGIPPQLSVRLVEQELAMAGFGRRYSAGISRGRRIARCVDEIMKLEVESVSGPEIDRRIDLESGLVDHDLVLA